MGWCHQFGTDIQPGCDHPMEAASDCCHCRVCGVVCEGRYGGCPSVWATAGVDGVAFAPVRPDDGAPAVQAFAAVDHEAGRGTFTPAAEPVLLAEAGHATYGSRVNGDAGRSVESALRALVDQVGRLTDELARQGNAVRNLEVRAEAASSAGGGDLGGQIAAQLTEQIAPQVTEQIGIRIAAQIATDLSTLPERLASDLAALAGPQIARDLAAGVAEQVAADISALVAGQIGADVAAALLPAVVSRQESAAAGIIDAEKELRSLLGAVVSWVSELGDRVDDSADEHLG